MPDLQLAEALREANLREMSFAFIDKGGYGKLIVSSFEISPERISEAQQAMGGGIAVTGKCFGPISNMVFQAANGAPAALGLALQKAVQRDTGLHIFLHVQSAAALAAWQAARQKAINDLTRLAAEVAGAKRPGAAEALKEIHALIARLNANPPLSEIAHLRAFIRHDATITAAEEDPRLNIRGPLLKALESLKP